MGEFDEIVEEFLIESQEGLDQLDQDLVALEQRRSDPELLARIFRCAHTIKGTSGFLGLTKLEAVTHAGESLLSKLRDGELLVTSEIISHLLSMVDAIREMLRAIRASGQDGEGSYEELIAALRAAARGASLRVAAAPADANAPTAAAEASVQAASSSVAPGVSETTPSAAGEPVKPARGRKPRSKSTQRSKRKAPAAAPAAPAAAAEHATALEPAPAEPAAVEPPQSEERTAAIAAAPRHERAPAEPARAPQNEADHRANGFESVRVDVELLDRLVDLAGELVLTRNQIRQVQGNLGDAGLNAATQRLNLVTMGLQEGIMRMRMQPIDSLFSKFPRMVRDVARTCNKLVRCEIDGKSTELDKTLIESIKDPLTHLLRNAIDHGIESPERRVQAGKPAEGRILVRASHQSGQVHIEILDDGAGIDVERVRAKALSQGLVSAERASTMSDGELVNLIFLPGFSTAQAVTSVSGRGVGMDVVKTNVERIGGAVEIETQLGAGTTFRIKVPLTLAIVPALIVTVAGARYAVPQVALQELVVVDADRSRQRIEQVHGAPVYRLRNKLLPLVFLSEQLGHQSRQACYERRKVHIAVLFAGGRQFGLVVDHVSDQQEIVVKPLASALKSLSVFAGATIMGDGRVVLILDVTGLAVRASLSTDARDESTAPASIDAMSAPLSSLLLLRGPDDARLAVPLARVARLETVPRQRLEEAAGKQVLQYGSEIMPVVELGGLLPERRLRPRHEGLDQVDPEHLNLVVLLTPGGHLAVAVSEILDVVDVPLVLKTGGNRSGVAGTLVIQQRVTELLDVDWIIEQSGVNPPALLEAV